MNWNNPEMEIQYSNGMPYNSLGSFVDFFGGVAYDHVNFIFADPSSYSQENVYPSMSNNFYKYGFTEPGSFSYYNYNYGDNYLFSNQSLGNGEYTSRPTENPHPLTNEQTTASRGQRGGIAGPNADSIPMECPRNHQSNREEVVWQDNIDPDNMTYEELLELGEVVGTQSRGLPEDLISCLPVSKYKRSLFSRKRSRKERCVICQMEYKRGDKRMTLPCKHIYHADCCRKWLGINKACPICYTEVRVDVQKH
ncbi:hypothetical protein LIER_10565 [Lithospermum erythrorhizon]|uniref:RING-type domain-containing protein n=1 Tax=Lithospermum erythrorhizon TaxID=34254 RepID=A0AAV3PM26_LITER